MSLTNYPNGLASMGIPVLGGGSIPVTYGNYYFVEATLGNDGNSGKSMGNALKTFEEAVSRVATNKDDVIVLSGVATHNVENTVLLTKNRVHIVGLGTPSRTGMQGTKIQLPSGVDAIQVLKNTGVRNSFHNVKFINGSDETTSKYGFVENGEGTLLENCAFHMNKELDETGVSDFLMSGDSCSFMGCTFGNDNLLSAGARTTFLFDGISGGASALTKNCYFEDCIWQVMTSSSSHLLMEINDTAAVDFGTIFKNCIWFNVINAALGGIQPTVAISSASGLVSGTFLFINPATNAASFSTTSDQFEVCASPIASQNAFEAVTPS